MPSVQRSCPRSCSNGCPIFFDGSRSHLKIYASIILLNSVEFETEPLLEKVDSREENALDALAHAKPKRRIRGLELLAQLEHEDLYEWCTLLLADESVEVRTAALQTIVHCNDGDTELLLPFVESQNKRIRAAAIAALAKHSAEDAPHWFERGLKDREVCVRLETASLLPTLDAIEHREIFELALYDPNPEIRNLAQNLLLEKAIHMLDENFVQSRAIR